MVEDAGSVHGSSKVSVVDALSCFGGGKSGEGGAGRVGGSPAEWMRVGACARWSGWQGSCSSEGWFGVGTGALGLNFGLLGLGNFARGVAGISLVGQ